MLFFYHLTLSNPFSNQFIQAVFQSAYPSRFSTIDAVFQPIYPSRFPTILTVFQSVYPNRFPSINAVFREFAQSYRRFSRTICCPRITKSDTLISAMGEVLRNICTYDDIFLVYDSKNMKENL